MGPSPNDSVEGTGAEVFEEIYDQGVTRYVGAFFPETDPAPDADGVKHWEFAVPSNPAGGPRVPLCLRGGQWTVDTREGDSDELVIFLQGGGACWPELCSANEEAGRITASGVLSPTLPGNPVADWDVVYLPYCDGSLFGGDVDRDLPASALGEGGGVTPGYQRGLQNLTSALDIAWREFPDPERILLTGVSGGAFGTIVALPLVRFYYPETEILVFNDSGIGVARGEREFVDETLLAGWNAESLLPASCTDCTSNGHVTRYIDWQLDQDPNVTMSAMSFSGDIVIAVSFLRVMIPQFTEALLAETATLASSHPHRYKRFIAEGNGHTVLLQEEPREIDAGGLPIEIGGLQTAISGTTVLEWLAAMVEGTDAWTNLVDDGLTE